MKLLKLCILLGGFAVQTLARTGSSKGALRRVSECPLGEVHSTSSSECESTCFSKKCVPVSSIGACTCQNQFVRHEGICVPQTACSLFAKPTKRPPQKRTTKRTAKRSKKTTKVPHKRKETTKAKTTTTPPEIIIKPDHPPPSCGRGQAFTLCVCDASCNTGNVCKSCKSGCGCFRHFVRDENGDCIAFEQCPGPRPATKPMAIIDLTDEKPGGSQTEGVKTLILTSDNFDAKVNQHEAEHFLRQMNTRTLANVSHMLDHKSERHKLASAILANSINLRQSVNSGRTPPPQHAQREPLTDLLKTLKRELLPTKHVNLTRRARRLRSRKRSSQIRRHHNSLFNSFFRLPKVKEIDPTTDSSFDGNKKEKHAVPQSLKGPLPPKAVLDEPIRNKPTQLKASKSAMSPGIRPSSSSLPAPEVRAPPATPPSFHIHGPIPPAKVKKLREKGRGMPPGKTPPSFGPPAMTPFVFFREKRVQRRQKKLEKIKSKLPFLRKSRS